MVLRDATRGALVLWFLGNEARLSRRSWEKGLWFVGLSFPRKKKPCHTTKARYGPTLPCPADSATGSEPLDGDNLEVEGKKVLSLFL